MKNCLTKSDFYFFTNTLNEILENNIIKFKNIAIICKDLNQELNLENLLKIKKFCKKNYIKFYIADNFKLAIKLKSDGIFISSWNKKKISFYKPNFELIGGSHNQFEIYCKKNQGCKKILLSPIFQNSKYKKNNILGTVKFNLMSRFVNGPEIIALGGINGSNFKKIYLTKSSAIGFISWVYSKQIKKPVLFLKYGLNY